MTMPLPLAESDAIVRLVYASRAHESADAGQRMADVRAILATARTHNPQCGISGLLIVANGHFLQVLEGPRGAVDALYERILRDSRHHDITLLSIASVVSKSFAQWSMGQIERTEPESVTAARLEVVRQRLAKDPAVDSADFFRLILAPSVNAPPALPTPPASGAQAPARPRSNTIASVAFASLTGMWGAAVVQHVSGHAMVRTGRTTVIDPADPAQRSLIEYVDIDPPEIGPMRALSLTADPAAFAPMAPLMERLSLIVFMLASSDINGFVAHVQSWLALPQVMNSGPEVLVLAGLPAERVLPLIEEIRATSPLKVSFANVKLSDAAAVWKTAQKQLRAQVQVPRAAPAESPRPPRAKRSAKSLFGALAQPLVPAQATATVAATLTAATKLPAPLARKLAAAEAARLQTLAAPALEESISALAKALANTGCLQALLALEGATRAGVLETEPAAVLLSTPGPGSDREHLAGDAAFLRSHRLLLQTLTPDDAAEDISLTTTTELKIFRPLTKRPDVFIGVTLARASAELAVARLKLQELVLAIDLLPL